ncbi:MAG: AMP-binding protein [Deltaproteobacteria bacterium]|nr:AMP-binding protein [Deltaproteobacteria bacterium]MBW2074495.1 AMP-binding protein [Deltaproteobacteria bacterium]RLB82641.1 MAG: phenylacetate--CoA ligase family protein [Deltaproteobacteria bacterium]
MTARIDRTSGYYNQTLETLSPEDRATYQNAELQKIVQYAYKNAPAIRKKLDSTNTKPDDIKCVKDLERLPITHKHELAQLQQQDPPFGGFLGVPWNRLKRICMSPGPIYEPEEIHSQNDRWTQAFFSAGFRKGDIGQITFSYHLVPPAFWFEDALHRLGCIATPGGVGNTELQVRMMHDLKVTGYVGTPSFLVNISKKAREVGYDLQKDLYLEVGFVAGEMLPDSLRNELEASFGMIVRQGYGTADVGCLAFECYHKNGMHFPYNCIVEIVDPETGRQLGPGETGEVVATIFDQVYPMIRFGTGDLSYFTDEPCPCGRTANRLVKILGRLDQVTKVKGMFIHPDNADEVAARFPEISRYQVVVTREAHVDQMTFAIELKEGVEATEALAKRIESAIPNSMRVRGKVTFIERGTLPEDYKKIDDRRRWN